MASGPERTLRRAVSVTGISCGLPARGEKRASPAWAEADSRIPSTTAHASVHVDTAAPLPRRQGSWG